MVMTSVDSIGSDNDLEGRRWQDPADLICPGCAEPVRPEPPPAWHLVDGPLPDWSHEEDGTALCAENSDDGRRPADPLPVTW
jgi:hypothetical protein